MKKTRILEIIAILLILFVLNYARMEYITMNLEKTKIVTERLFNTKNRTIIIDNGETEKTYTRNLNRYSLEIKEKGNEEKVEKYFYDRAEDIGIAVIDGNISKISEENLYLENQNEEKVQTKETVQEKENKEEEAKQEVQEKVESKSEEVKKEDEVEKETLTDEEVEKINEVKEEESRRTFVELFETPEILDKYIEDIFWVWLSSNEQGDKYIFKRFKQGHIIVEKRSMHITEYNEEGKTVKITVKKDSYADKIEMPKLEK